MNNERRIWNVKVKRHGRLLIAVAAIVAFAACNGSQSDESNSTSSASTKTEDNSPYAAGKTIYQKTCIVCHGASGEGTPGTYPPLAHSDFLLADKGRAIRQVISGSSTTYTVNGASYNGMMPPQQLSDEEVAEVLNYVYHTWGNNGFTVTSADVKAVK